MAGQPLDVFVASDDEDAKAKVRELAESAGLRVLDAGPLAIARQLEGAGYLHMAIQPGLGGTLRQRPEVVRLEDCRRTVKVIAVESSVTFALIIMAMATVTGSPSLLVAGLACHGLKDLWQHRTPRVASTRWSAAICMVVSIGLSPRSSSADRRQACDGRASRRAE